MKLSPKVGVVGTLFRSFGCLAGDATSLMERQELKTTTDKLRGLRNPLLLSTVGRFRQFLCRKPRACPRTRFGLEAQAPKPATQASRKATHKPEADQSFQSLWTRTTAVVPTGSVPLNPRLGHNQHPSPVVHFVGKLNTELRSAVQYERSTSRIRMRHSKLNLAPSRNPWEDLTKWSLYIGR